MNRSIYCALLGLLCYGLSAQNESNSQLIDGLFAANILAERQPLAETPIREADVNWQKKIFRVIDTREKMNLGFRYPVRPLFEILVDGILENRIQAYSPEVDDFSIPMSIAEISKQLHRTDTVEIWNPATNAQRLQVVTDDFDPAKVIRWRVKEIWYTDTKDSRLKVRTLGLAPVIEEYTEMGELKYEQVLFWVYLPHCRKVLMEEPVFNPHNEMATMSWDDLFKMRFYSSYVYKEGNIHDRRIKDYRSGRDLLLESRQIEQGIYNREMDMWSY